MTLIAKLEAAKEGSRELDAEIHLVIAPEFAKWPYDPVLGVSGLWFHNHGEAYAPHYTTSLDAAMTLKPDGHRLRLWQHHTGVWGCDLFPDGGGTLHRVHDKATPALALVIACLKARP